MILRTIAAMLIAFPVAAQPITIPETKVTFEPPTGFEAVPQEIIDLKWPTSRAPKNVVGNEAATTTVAYELKMSQLSTDQLPEAQRVFQSMFERMIPGLVWKRNELVQLSGQTWLWMEMTSSAIDTDIYNMLLLTGYDGRMLIFNFNSTIEDFPQYEVALRESIQTIQLPK